MTSIVSQTLSRNSENIVPRANPQTAQPLSRSKLSDTISAEQIPGCYVGLDLGWRIVEVNSNAVEFARLRRVDMVGRLIWEVFTPATYPSVRDLLERSRSTNAFLYLEFQHGLQDDPFLLCVNSHSLGTAIIFDRIADRKTLENQILSGVASPRLHKPPAHDAVYMITAHDSLCESFGPTSLNLPGLCPDSIGEEFLGGIERIHPDDRKIFTESFEERRFPPTADGSVFADYRWQDTRGEYHWFCDARRALRAGDGRIIAFVGSLRDVSPWKGIVDQCKEEEVQFASELEGRDETRRAFPTSESRYKAIVENQSDLVSRFRPDGTISFVNEAYARFFGLDRSQCIGTSYTTLVHPDDYVTVQQQLASLSPVNPTVTIENRVFRYDGESRWVQWTNHALYNIAGTLVEYQSSGRDITDRRNAEQLLAAQYEVTSLLAESETVEAALRGILELIAARFEWDLVALWTLAEGGTLPNLALACSPGSALRSLTLPRTGLPQRIFERKKVEWLHPARDGKSGLRAAGYRTIVAFPVRAGDDVMAVIECYDRTERATHDKIVESLGAIGHQIGNYWKRELAEESLRRSAEHLEEKIRKRTQELANALEALSNSEVLFRTMIESAPMGIVLLDEDGVIAERNRSLERMLGYPEEGLVRVLFETLVMPVDQPKVRTLLSQLDPAANARSLTEIRMRRIDGGVVWGSISASPIVLGGTDRRFATVMIRDITERKLVEEELRRSDEQFRSVFSEAPIGIALLDRDGRHVRTNQALHEMLRYAPGTLDGMELGDIVHPDDLSTERTNVQAMASGTMHRYHREMRFLRRDGTTAWATVNGTAIRTDDGELLFCLRLVEDITEQKQLQQMLVETERRRSEDLRKFATNVQRAQEEERQRIARELHDDICQRLSGMKLNMEVLEDEIRLTDRRTSRILRGFRKQFEQTISEVRRLSSNLRPTVLDDFGLTIAMNLLVRDFERMHGISVHLESKGLSVERLDPQVEIALYRIAQESLTNVARHAEADTVDIELLARDKFAELTIRDNGRGFDETESMNAREAGHGMGLISMRERAELLGGTCLVSSRPTDGTTVFASIPLEGAGTHEKSVHLDR